MITCQEHWCEYYGKNDGNCATCEKREKNIDKPVERVILKRRQKEMMKLDKSNNKNKAQKR